MGIALELGVLPSKMAMARRERHMTQLQLGQLLEPEMSQATVSNVEHGKSASLELLKQIAEVLEFPGDPKALQEPWRGV